MTLSDGIVGSVYQVESLSLPKKLEMRLVALGMTPGTDITVLNKKRHGALIFNVRGTRLAVGHKIAQSITVK